MHDATEQGHTLITNPKQPTRTGLTSLQRDTTPDLTFFKNGGEVTWRNTGEDLGSDHYILEVELIGSGGRKIEHKWTDWDAFRKQRMDGTVAQDIADIEEWTAGLKEEIRRATKKIETAEDITCVDSKLAHLLEAKTSIKERWKKQRWNRKLRKKMAELNQAIAKHSALLSRQQWDEVCSRIDGPLHQGRARSLIRHLLDETTTKSYQQNRMARVMHEAEKSLGRDELIKRLSDKYLPETKTEQHPEYAGAPNDKLDRDIATAEVVTALQELNTRSAAGPDGVSNKALRNLDDPSIEALTRYYNQCWRSGKLPDQWKKAKTVLIPKPGKPLNIENLRPISLTSCVGKVLEHVLAKRWQNYLEQEGLYPDSIIGFRRGLSTQDAMLQLKKEIIENETKDSKVILGLDLQSAFDRVKHSAILAQASRLNMGNRSYEYIRNFLSDRKIALHAGEIKLPERRVGSVGTPQGSVISPFLFNIVMIQVAEAVSSVKGVRYTIYADDLTLWTTGGTDAGIEMRLQKAISAIEERLDGTGLQCSPSKSELLVYSPRKAGWQPPPPRECDRMELITKMGQRIPEVSEIRVLGMLISSNGSNGSKDNLLKKLATKTASTLRLIQRVSTKKAGMREEGLTRLVQSFAISHVAYTAAYHTWTQTDKNKIDAMIRRLYKRALGLRESTNTERLLQLGVHNTVDEIIEAQLEAQRERLAETKTGRSILETLGYGYRVTGRHLQELDEKVRENVRVSPIPRNVHPEHNQERRRARAKFLVEQYCGDTRTRYVDAAEYGQRRYALVTVNARTGRVSKSASAKCENATEAEEIAIALAMSEGGCDTILSDSQEAVRNLERGRVSGKAARIIERSGVRDGRRVEVRWIPAHAGNCSPYAPNHNETAHREARAITHRGPNVGTRPEWEWWTETKDRARGYGETLKTLRLARRAYPPPHRELGREEAIHLRRLQTASTTSPASLHQMYPDEYPSDQCSVCKKGPANRWYIMWDCAADPDGAHFEEYPEELQRAIESTSKTDQSWAIQQVFAALERHGLRKTGL